MAEREVVGGRFELEALSGAGGMGRVYRARDLASGHPVAVKVLSETTDTALARFEREAQLLARLHHPHIVRYYAHGRGPGGPWLAMEWLEGEPLAARLARGPLAVDATLVLGRAVAGALAAIHGEGLVHRDVKPSNLFLPYGRVERVKLLDFGVARLRDAGALTRTGRFVGTVGYGAPEQAQAGGVVDARADVFALGCVLFEALAGRPAFRGEGFVAVLAKTLLEDPPRLGDVADGVPPALAELVGRMLAKSPGERPDGGAAVIAALDAVPAGERGPAAAARPALTTDEQQLVTVVLARPHDAPQAGDATVTAEADGGLGEAVRAAVTAAGGRLEELADGSLLTAVAAPRPAEQAELAARCALSLAQVAPGGRFALATGRAVVGRRRAMGEAIDRAALLLEQAPPGGGVRVDDVTAGLLDGRFDLRGDERGLSVRGERAAADPPRTLLGRPTPLVGRARELATLLGVFDEVLAEGRARAVVVSGPAGIGKSRLAAEVRRALAGRDGGAEVWVARGDARDPGPVTGLAPVIRWAAAVVDAEPLEVRRRKLRARVARHLDDADAGRVAEFLGELAGVPFPDEASAPLRAARRDLALMAAQVQRAWGDWLVAEASHAPLVLLVEDAHWLGPAALATFEHALARLAGLPVLVLALARPEAAPAMLAAWAAHEPIHVALAELSSGAAERLVRGALGETADAARVARLVERAGGNPLYLEELLRGRSEELPASVLAAVASRLGDLSVDARRALRAASVFGEVCWRPGVAALLGDAEGALTARCLQELIEREVLVARPSRRFHDDDELVFRHALVREAAYAQLTEVDRELGHRLAAVWLTGVGEADPALLALHWERGARPAEAAARWVEAARRAADANDLEAVLERVGRAVAAGATGELLGRARLVEAQALSWRGEFVAAATAARAAARLLPAGGPAWCLAQGELALSASRRGDVELLAEAAAALRAHPPETAHEPSWVTAAARVANHLLFAGRYDESRDLLARLSEAVDALAERDPGAAAAVLESLAVRLVYSGEPGANAMEPMARATVAYDRAGDLRRACLQRANLGFVAIEAGAYERAEEVLTQAVELAGRLGLPNVAAHARQNLGLALAQLGRHAEARAALEAAIAVFHAQRDHRLEGSSKTYLARVLLDQGDVAGARRLADEATALLEVAPPLRALALAVAARAAAAAGDAAGAHGLAARAMALLADLGAVEEGEALVRLVYAEALAAVGRDVEARAALADARAHVMTRADRIVDAEARRTYLERVPEHARTLALAAAWELAP